MLVPCSPRLDQSSGPPSSRLADAATIAFRPRLPMSPLALWVHPGLSLLLRSPQARCVFHRRSRRVLLLETAPAQLSLVRRVLSSTLLPKLLRPCLLSTIRESAALCLLPAPGSPAQFSLLTPRTALGVKAVGFPWVRRASSPYPVQLHQGSVLRISGLAHARLLDPLPLAI